MAGTLAVECRRSRSGIGDLETQSSCSEEPYSSYLVVGYGRRGETQVGEFHVLE